jgi:hypothetical protein
MGLIDKAAIFAAQDLKSEDVEVGEWGGSVRVRELSAADLLGFWDACRDAEGKLVPLNVQPELLLRAVVGADGTPLFTVADVSELMKKSARNIGRLFEVAQKLNGIGHEAEDIAKNSDAAPSGVSPSASA